ncbi:ATP-dependent 6-phosphofructokinase [Candidatus Dojkabacteria bacterium]|nr:ATP-dependent 6-phosphofructokinase [Candidatus Dojkabacteria bacterium]
MEKQAKRIGIVNSGGDCAGMNAVLSAVVKTGVSLGYEFIGFRYGFEGVLNPARYIPMNLDTVRGISHLGGTILQTVNKGRFAAKVGAGEERRIPTEILEEAKSNIDRLGIEALIVIGGDGTQAGALQLQEEMGINIVAVPKSIDNDLRGTDRTFGLSTAVDIVTEAHGKIHSTAMSHDRVIIIEVMGRYTGWLALYGGLGGGSKVILIPEIPFKVENIVNFLRSRVEIGERSTVIAVAEGAKEKDMEKLATDNIGGTQEVHLGGIADYVMERIKQIAPNEFEMRTLVLGHLQRGGMPNAEDRILSYRYGVAAMNAVHNQNFGKMVCLRGGEIKMVDIREAVSGLKMVDPDSEIVRVARSIGVCFGD